MNDDAGRALALALLLLCLPIAATVGAGAQASGTPAAANAAADEDGAAVGANETVRHQHPDEYAADGDSDGIEAWLSNRLSSQLQNSTIALSRGEYDLAREFVGEEYRERLEQYVEVAGDAETGGTDDGDETDGDGDGTDERTDPGEAFEDAAEQQESFANLTQAYRETKAEYDLARQEGEEVRARELARELDALAADIAAVGGELVVNYEVISFETDEDLSAATEAIDETRTDIEAEQTVVREEQFLETELRLDVENESASFLEPLVATGEIRAANGSAVDAGEGQLLVDGDPVDVKTGSDGTVEFEYRPTTQPLSAETVTVEYVPAAQSPYLGSETALNVSLEGVEPTISNLEATDAVAYGDALSVEGELAASDVPVDGVALEVRLDGELLGELEVADGAFDGSVPVPSAVRDGDRTLEVSLPFDDRVLAGVAAETPVTVEETETVLEIDAALLDESDEGNDEGNESGLQVDGTLETAAGDGIGTQPVDIRVDGETVATVTTDADGEFSETATVPSAANGDVDVVARYDGEGTNLATTATETAVSLPGAHADGSESSIPSWAILVGAAAAVVGIGVGWWKRRSDLEQNEDGSGSELEREPVAESPSADSPADSPELVDALLSRASDHLSNGRANDAVRTSYAAVRHEYETAPDTPAALTHWEFYRRLERASDPGDETTDRLRAVIAEYERAAFAPDGVSAPAATRVLERTRRLCNSATGSTGETPASAD